MAFSLRAYAQNPTSYWRYPPNPIKSELNEVEKRFMENLFPSISKERTNFQKLHFIHWFDALLDDVQEEFPSVEFSHPQEKIISYLKSIYRRDYLRNFRAALGIANVFRSPNPALYIDEKPLLNDFLQKNEISLVVDLRGAKEKHRDPQYDEYMANLGIEVLLVDFNEPSLSQANLSHENRDVYTGYVRKLHCLRNTVKTIFEHFVKTPGAVLFHCAGGQDRTGVIVGVFQLLAGCSHDMIIEGYTATGHNATKNRIQAVLNYIDAAEYGGGRGIQAYLRTCEISEAILDKAKSKIRSQN